MIELNIIEREDPCIGWLDMLKKYASVPDDSQDALLNALLVKACLRVQEMADRSILGCTFELREDNVEDETVRLYQSVSDILYVRAADGRELGWSMRGKALRVYESDVVVRYKTEARAGDVADLLPVVYQYATALYDGEESVVLANILKQCR